MKSNKKKRIAFASGVWEGPIKEGSYVKYILCKGKHYPTCVPHFYYFHMRGDDNKDAALSAD